MINGAHVIVYSKDAEADRAFLRDALGFSHIDVGQGWLLFKLPPAEMAVHPSDENNKHELFLMCDDIDRTVDELTAKGAEFAAPISTARFGRLTRIRIPGGGEIGLYQPSHPTAYDLEP